MENIINEDISLVIDILKREGCIKNLKAIDGNESIIPAGGKMLRPRLVVTTARLCGYDGGRHIECAAAIEIFHNSTLFHDDVIDSAESRRGEISLNKKYGDATAILAGDMMIARSFGIAAGSGGPEIAAAMSDCLAELVYGQLRELDHDRDLCCTPEDYFTVIDNKTASLLRTSVLVGALVASADKATTTLLSDIAFRAGRLFQIADDVIDYLGDERDTGKCRFQDLRQGKMTLPAILLAQRSSAEERNFFNSCLGNAFLNDNDGEIVITIMDKYGILSEIFEDYRNRHDALVFLMNGLKPDRFLPDFKNLILSLVTRLYKYDSKKLPDYQ